MDNLEGIGEILDSAAKKEISLEGGVTFPLEYLEELRLYLGSFLKPEVLDALLKVYKVLNKEPRQTEQYSWFLRNSQFGKECKYAIAALNHFKRTRLDELEKVLVEALEKIRLLKEEQK